MNVAPWQQRAGRGKYCSVGCRHKFGPSNLRRSVAADYSQGKTCAGCKEFLSPDMFAVRRSRNSLDSYCRLCRSSITRSYNRRNPGQLKARNDRRSRSNGVSYSEFIAMKEAQQGVCAICENPETSLGTGGKVRELNVDHCHESGKTRGLLCSRCNMMLGLAKDNPKLLGKALDYLEVHHVSG